MLSNSWIKRRSWRLKLILWLLVDQWESPLGEAETGSDIFRYHLIFSMLLQSKSFFRGSSSFARFGQWSFCKAARIIQSSSEWTEPIQCDRIKKQPCWCSGKNYLLFLLSRIHWEQERYWLNNLVDCQPPITWQASHIIGGWHLTVNQIVTNTLTLIP